MDIKTYIEHHPYQAYSYSYPHKNSYRRLRSPLSTGEAWKQESLSSLFLYLHIPFCEMRCGFCNLFTLANPKDDLTERYLQTLLMEIERTGRELDSAKYSRLAFGGGTPSLLSIAQLEKMFLKLTDTFKLDINTTPTSFEVSPYTAVFDKIKYLKDVGVDRISIGIQSFIEDETRQIGRHQPPVQVSTALDNIVAQDFSTLNIDLIYGIPGQTQSSWQQTLVRTLEYAPQEIYLYPLYIRPLTGIGKRSANSSLKIEVNSNEILVEEDKRKQLYQIGRDYLFENGYEQISLRMFRKKDRTEQEGPVYRCQEDGMVGLGVGARSYTSKLHYSSRYAVNRSGVRDIINQYIDSYQSLNPTIDYGFTLDVEDQRRRYLILSLLSTEGVEFARYQHRFNRDIYDDFPELTQLEEFEFAEHATTKMILTAKGLQHSDSIGPWLYSEKVNRLIGECELK